MTTDKRGLWLALIAGSMALTLWPLHYHASNRQDRREVCHEVTEQILQAVDRGDLSTKDGSAIITRCYKLFASGSAR